MNNFITPDLNEYDTYGIGQLDTTEGIRFDQGSYANSNGTTNWAFPALTDWTALMKQNRAYVAQTSPDEYQNGHTDPPTVTIVNALLGDRRTVSRTLG